MLRLAHYRWLAAAALSGGAISSCALLAFASGGWSRVGLGYIAWALMPYAVLVPAYVVTYLSGVSHAVRVLIAWGILAVVVVGSLLYVDALFWHVDAQGALAILMVPVIQAALAVLAIVAAAVWQWRITRAGAKRR